MTLGTIAATVVLIGATWWRVSEVWLGVPRATAEYLQAAAEAIDAVPYKIGPWLGQDVEVSPAAVELLKPNRILQRVYTAPGSVEPGFSLLISHCGTTKDMAGHYPPICYPAHGWTPRSDRPIELDSRFGTIPARAYRFTRGRGLGRIEMSVINFFVLPSEESRFRSSMDELMRLDVIRSRHADGIAQVQVLISEEATEAQQKEIIRSVLDAIDGAILGISERSET